MKLRDVLFNELSRTKVGKLWVGKTRAERYAILKGQADRIAEGIEKYFDVQAKEDEDQIKMAHDIFQRWQNEIFAAGQQTVSGEEEEK